MPELLVEGGDDGLQHTERINDILAKRSSNEAVHIRDIG